MWPTVFSSPIVYIERDRHIGQTKLEEAGDRVFAKQRRNRALTFSRHSWPMAFGSTCTSRMTELAWLTRHHIFPTLFLPVTFKAGVPKSLVVARRDSSSHESNRRRTNNTLIATRTFTRTTTITTTATTVFSSPDTRLMVGDRSWPVIRSLS